MYLGNSDRLLGPDRHPNSFSSRIRTKLRHILQRLYYRQQPHYHLKMAEIKRPVGLLFDIGGVCVSGISIPGYS
ncbi:hypothetical protein ACN42_g2575 [Penicillium freii]|uniref:Uncharacterized protein n=1 Tax=Penicillium freii TaxID=48697 RepID=A0A101MPT6_PENFR|nr:hypothetical protein ACN42_g2575 [Penicillium freii]